MRKNTVKRAIKKVSKKAVKNPEITVATTAVVSGFAVFGAIETGLIIKNKAKTKIAEIKTKKEEEKKKKEEEAKKKANEETTKATEEEKKNNNEEAVA